MAAPGGTSPERLHSLDAARAFALMMGVLFHAAWSFQAIPWGAPVVDVSRHFGFDGFMYLSHAFRMPLFFLIAGFFARMLYHGRGVGGFARNRFMRIVIPLALGWLVLHPLTVMAWNFGANAAGANLTAFTVPMQMEVMAGQGRMFVPPSQGGMFNLGHLWFLYYLIWLYALALSACPVLSRLPGLAARADRLVASLVRKPWTVAGLAFATGLLLWRMDGWFGVDTPSDSLVPSVPVLLFYMATFAFGWLLHRQPELLQEFSRRWKMFISMGLLLACICFGVFYHLSEKVVTLGPPGSMYPALWPTQVTDWPHFMSTLQSASKPDAPPALARFWKNVPEWDRGPILALPPDPDPSVKVGLCRNLSRLLSIPDLLAPGHPADARLDNRRRLEDLFGGALAADPREMPWYGAAKFIYATSCGLMTWLLVYGVLGFCQARFRAPNPLLRYISDSSYWIYLIHLPAILALQGWMFAWPWPGLLKYCLLLGTFFTGAIGSYHLMVRSTVIGRVLNGRRRGMFQTPEKNIARKCL